MRIFRDFHFEAAHHLPHAFPDGHVNQRLHGHSFRVRITLSGAPSPETGLIEDLGRMMEIAAEVREQLDHHYLNDIEGLEKPTLENLSQWIWRKLAPALPGLYQVGVYRDSCGEGCDYNGEFETEDTKP
ncbi:6-pyruvoyl trahydropterin synthase family protein [Sneathiella chinensis]|uniref:6-carboxy-5,6,7,8-tetrahydropterin synthase n=1 Tax=Sneathiella chinensis TaxID=349750 RepID=A0ABQ5UA48_9PROT|nr:6-carboxytetrahydropterin synthase [Sneathiella chinensis]GLQ07406.1 6-carboxy-5,6,7,8-tetrahydropterin synthase [Sneathiella chinensis]